MQVRELLYESASRCTVLTSDDHIPTTEVSSTGTNRSLRRTCIRDGPCLQYYDTAIWCGVVWCGVHRRPSVSLVERLTLRVVEPQHIRNGHGSTHFEQNLPIDDSGSHRSPSASRFESPTVRLDPCRVRCHLRMSKRSKTQIGVSVGGTEGSISAHSKCRWCFEPCLTALTYTITHTPALSFRKRTGPDRTGTVGS